MTGWVGYSDPKVLIGYENADDAGVYLLDDRTALVQTVDFFTPVVDDPYDYGRVAAANALSDIYAMGGEPKFALSIACFPKAALDVADLRAIAAGGAAKLAEARVPVIGGHSVHDEEIKFGYCVTGLIDPRALLSNASARAGDRLILTKPLGTGIVATAVKAARAEEGERAAALESMLLLNGAAAACARRRARAATDVTGYGLIGHALEMAKASGVTLRLRAADVPLLPGASRLAAMGMLAGGVRANAEYVRGEVAWQGVDETTRSILLDPQTSGGLLLSVPFAQAAALAAELTARGQGAALIGEVVPRGAATVEVEP